MLKAPSCIKSVAVCTLIRRYIPPHFSLVIEQNLVLSNLFIITGNTLIEQLVCSRHIRCGSSKYLTCLEHSNWGLGAL